MNKREKLIVEQLIHGEKYYYRSLSVDNVIFGYHERKLKILLLKPVRLQNWILPGGYVKKKETIKDAAQRTVRYRTRLKDIKLVQFKTFGDPNRIETPFFTPDVLKQLTNQEFEIKPNHWLLVDFISIGYFALTEYSQVKPRGDFYAEECQWWDIHDLPQIGFDHKHIIEEALVSLKIFTYHYPIGKQLLPEKFTIPELQSLYETILDKKIDNRNFTKKMLTIGLIENLNEKRNIGGHRSPFLYRFNENRYNEIISNGELIVI